jgi:hypothetical protein
MFARCRAFMIALIASVALTGAAAGPAGAAVRPGTTPCPMCWGGSAGGTSGPGPAD